MNVNEIHPDAELYGEPERFTMKVAEDSLNPRSDRVRELIAFAREARLETIGIANCITFEKEAEVLEKLLQLEGFRVIRSNCKTGRLPRTDILPGYNGYSCNPAGQARILEEGKSQMNIVMGLCLGHDIVFNARSKAMTTTLLVKDRKHHHQPLEAFENLDGED